VKNGEVLEKGKGSNDGIHSAEGKRSTRKRVVQTFERKKKKKKKKWFPPGTPSLKLQEKKPGAKKRHKPLSGCDRVCKSGKRVNFAPAGKERDKLGIQKRGRECRSNERVSKKKKAGGNSREGKESNFLPEGATVNHRLPAGEKGIT